jgi:hypothetical protein
MFNFSLRAFVALFVFLSLSSVSAQTKVVVVPLGDADGVYSKITGTWFGTISNTDETYRGLISILETAKVGQVAASIGYLGDFFQCSAVHTRVSESGNTYNFTEQVVLNDGGCGTCATIVLTHNTSEDSLRYDCAGTEIGVLMRVIVAPE